MRTVLPFPLVLLGFRRTLSLSGWVVLAAILLFVASRRSELAVATPLPGSPEALDASLVRSTWGTFFVVALLASIWRGAHLGSAWRRRDFAWLGRLAPGALAVSAATVAGLGAGVLVASLLTLLVVRITSGTPGAAPPPHFIETLRHEPFLASVADSRTLVSVGPPRRTPGERSALLVVPSVAPGSGPAVDVRLTVRAANGAESTAERRIFARTPLVVEVPGPAPWELEIRRGPGAAVYLPNGSIALIARSGGTWSRDLGLFWRSLLGLFGFGALAMGLGAWMRTSLAVAASSCAFLAPLSFLRGPGPSPAGDLPQVLERLALGVGPGPLPATVPVATLFVACIAVGLLSLALRNGGGNR